MSQTVSVKVSNRYQIALPSEARRKLKIESGDRLLIDIQDGMLVLIPEPKDYVAYMAGLHKNVWADTDTTRYWHEEREAWQPSNSN